MIIVCAWCQKDMGEKEPLEDRKVSHGICPSCSEDVMLEAERLRSSMAERQLGKLEAVGSIRTEGSMSEANDAGPSQKVDIQARFKELEASYGYTWDDDNKVARRPGQTHRSIDESIEDSSAARPEEKKDGDADPSP